MWMMFFYKNDDGQKEIMYNLFRTELNPKKQQTVAVAG